MNFDDKIVYLSVLEGGKLALADKTKKFYILDLSSMHKEHEHSFKHALAHSEKMSISFSPNGRYLAYSEKEQSVVRVIDLHEQKLHHSFPTLHNQIETLCFDPTSSYLVAGSITGRVYLWNLFLTGQVSRLSSFPEYSPHLFSQPTVNYVSSACFSPSGNLVATSGYGGSIVITNIHTEVMPVRITPNHVRINSLCFINEDTLAAGNIEGGLYIIDLLTSQIKKHYQTSLVNINTMCVTRSGSYLLISGHTKNISLIDLKTQKILNAEYIRLGTKVTRLAITADDTLIVGCEDGSVTLFNLNPQALLQQHLDAASYDKGYDLLHKFPLLSESSLVHTLESAWESILEQAIAHVQKNETDKALKLLNKFSNVPSKYKVIKEFQSLITYFERFKTAVEHENYALAYSMAEKIGLLKHTAPYMTMEEIWDATFLKAQVHIIKDETHALFKLLEPFSRVTTKLCFIQVLLHQPDRFVEFTHLINSHAYDKIFEITKTYPCLKEIQSYQKIIDATDVLYEKFRQHIHSRDYELAELDQEALSHIPYMKTKRKVLMNLLKLAKKLENYYKKEKYASCYTLIDKHKELQSLPLVHELEEVWNTKMQEAEKEALLGHAKGIKAILGDLITLQTRALKVGMLLRLSYLTQIKFLVIRHQLDSVPKAMDAYIKMFGFDTELHNLITKLKKDKTIDIELTVEQQYRRPRSLWLNLTEGNVPDTILDERDRV